MIAHRTMSDETDLWLEVRQAKYLSGRAVTVPLVPGLSPYIGDVPACNLTDAEIDWLWPRYQRCSFPPATFAKRFACTARESLTPRGKNAAVKLAYRYRRQIFGSTAVKWSWADFIDGVRRATRAQLSPAGEPKDPAREIVSSASTASISPGEECPGAHHPTKVPAPEGGVDATSFVVPPLTGAGAITP